MSNIINRLWNRTPKVIEIPTDVTVKLAAIETWCVEWAARSGQHRCSPHLSSCRSVVQAFTNEADARAFEKALRDSFALVRDTITPYSIRVHMM